MAPTPRARCARPPPISERRGRRRAGDRPGAVRPGTNTWRESDPHQADHLDGAIGIRIPGDGYIYTVDTVRGLLILHETTWRTATLLDSGQVLVAGGAEDVNDTSSDVYNPYSNQWLPGPSLPIPGRYVSATLLYSGEVLVLNEAGQAALYDPSTNAWRLAAPTQQVRGGSVTALLHTGQVLAIGDGAVERYTR